MHVSDIDECTDRAKNHCSAGEKCVNLEGSYRCKKESKAKIYVLVGKTIHISRTRTLEYDLIFLLHFTN